MPRFTNWRPLTERARDYNCPCVYELGMRRGRGRIWPVYTGESGNGKGRINAYASGGSHKRSEIYEAESEGYEIFFRLRAVPSKEHAKRSQDAVLARRGSSFPWNRNGIRR